MDILTDDVNDLPFDTAINLYRRLRKAILDDDQVTVEMLRAHYPSLFDEETAKTLRSTDEKVHRLTRKKNDITEH